MLHAVGELRQHLVGDVRRRLRDEVDSHTLRAHKLHHLDDLVHEPLGHVVEEQVRLVEEEHEPWLVGVTHLGQKLEERGEHPEQEHGIDLGRLDELGRIEDVHVPAAVRGAGKPVPKVKVGLAKEDVSALVLHRDERALDGADRLRRDVAVGGLVLLGVLGDIREHRTQVLEVYEEKAVLVSHAKNDVEDALLDLREAKDAGEHDGAHVRDGHAHGDAPVAQHVPDAHRGALEADLVLLEVEGVLAALADEVRHLAGLRHARDVALDVGHEDGHACLREALHKDLERDGLARARSARDEAVAVGLVEEQAAGLLALGNPDLVSYEHGASQRGL